MRKLALICLLAVFLVACASSETPGAAVTAITQAAAPTATPVPTVTPEPAATPTPTDKPAPTETPAPTATPKPTDTLAPTPSPTLAPTSTLACPCSIWTDSDQPAIPNANDGQPLQLGVKFRTEVDGFVTGVRFYKGSLNTGLHRGQLYAADGALLGEAVFTDETARGWQSVYFAAPVPVTAGVTYVASYYSASGYYAFSYGYFVAAISRPPLTALASGTDGRNGVYTYSAWPVLPTTSYGKSNYWVDVVFEMAVKPAGSPTAKP